MVESLIQRSLEVGLARINKRCQDKGRDATSYSGKPICALTPDFK